MKTGWFAWGLLVILSALAGGCGQSGNTAPGESGRSQGEPGSPATRKIDGLIKRGWEYFDSAAYTKANHIADSITLLAGQSAYTFGKGVALLLSGRSAFMTGNPDEAIRLERQALAIFDSTGYTEMQVKSLMALGGAFERLGKYQEAIAAYQRVFELQEGVAPSTVLAEAYNDLGIVRFRMGDYPEALKNYFSALKIHHALGDLEAAASVKNNIGLIYTREGKADQAMEYFQQAISETSGKPDGRAAAKAHANLGTLYAHVQNFDQATSHQLAALEIFRKSNDQSGMAEAYSGLGITHFNQDKLPEALDYFQKSVQLCRATGNQIFLASGLTNLGNVLSSMGDLASGAEARRLYHRALEYQQEAITIADSIRAREILANAFDGITFTYKGLDDMANALEYTERLLVLKDSLRNSQVDEQLEALRTQQAVDQAMAADKEQRQRRTERTWIALAVLALLALASGMFFRQRTLRIKERDRAETRQQLAELELQSLRAQLNPHFMFNSLNAIQELILLQENEKSHLYLSQFSELLRRLLDNADVPMIPLASELGFLHNYLKLEQLRLPDLSYEIHLSAGIRPEEVLIPNMLLQPYVENAIWHGLSPKPSGDRRVILRIRREDDRVIYEIEDNGIGRQRAAEIKRAHRNGHRSKGIELLGKRMALVEKGFDMEITTRIEDVVGDERVVGTLVTIGMPVNFYPKMKTA